MKINGLLVAIVAVGISSVAVAQSSTSTTGSNSAVGSSSGATVSVQSEINTDATYNDRDEYLTYVRDIRNRYNDQLNSLPNDQRQRYNQLNTQIDQDLNRSTSINESGWNRYRDNLNQNLTHMQGMFDTTSSGRNTTTNYNNRNPNLN